MWMHRLLPKARNVGILFDPAQNERRAAEGAEGLRRAGYTAILEPVTGPTALPNALNRLTNSIDVLHAIPDTTVFAREHARALLLFSFRNHIPLAGPTEAWVSAGALYAIDWDYADLGRYCAALALHQQAGGRAPPPDAAAHARDRQPAFGGAAAHPVERRRAAPVRPGVRMKSLRQTLRRHLSPLGADTVSMLNLPKVRMGLLAKLNLLTVGLIFLTAVTVTAFHFTQQWRDEEQQLRMQGASLMGIMAELAEYALYTSDRQHLDQMLDSIGADPEVAFVERAGPAGPRAVGATLRAGAGEREPAADRGRSRRASRPAPSARASSTSAGAATSSWWRP